MEFAIYYTAGAIILYLLADKILDHIEISRGARLKYRNVIFFFILFGLALVYMFLISPPPEQLPGEPPALEQAPAPPR